jgi:hypothetical protein
MEPPVRIELTSTVYDTAALPLSYGGVGTFYHRTGDKNGFSLYCWHSMTTLRSGRLEENKQKRRLGIAILGSIAIVIFLGLFGLNILVGFSLLVDKIRGTGPTTQTTEALLLPPILDPQPTATKSASLTVTGSGQEGTQITFYVNDTEDEKVSVNDDGTFKTLITSLTSGTNTISARAMDDNGNTSDPSNVLTIMIKKTPPIFEVSAPTDNATVNGESNKIDVVGKTEENTSVTINGRIVVIKSDNTFTYPFPLNEGDNKLTIVATDTAGNSTTIERKVTYHR